MSPDDDHTDTPLDKLTSPAPEDTLLLEPATTFTLPARPLPDAPTVMVIEPDDPPVLDSPVDNTRAPDAPAPADVPVAIDTMPLFPAWALADATVTAPLVAASPLLIVTAPEMAFSPPLQGRRHQAAAYL